MVEEFAVGGDYRSGKKKKIFFHIFKFFLGKRRGVKTILPRGQELWNTETMGHDVFKVASKYKYDENVDEKLPKSVDHPHFIYKKFH